LSFTLVATAKETVTEKATRITEKRIMGSITKIRSGRIEERREKMSISTRDPYFIGHLCLYTPGTQKLYLLNPRT